MENFREVFLDIANKINGNVDLEQIKVEIRQDQDIVSFINENKTELSGDVLNSHLAVFYEYHTQKDYRPETANIPGFIARLKVVNHEPQVVYVPTIETQMKNENSKIVKRFHRIGATKDVSEASLKDGKYFPNTPARITALEEYVKQRNNLLAKKPTKGLYLSGNFGTGKTYFLTAIADDLTRNGIEVLLVFMPDFAVIMKNAIRDNKVLSKINQVKNTPVLILDDIGAESLSPWFRDEVLSVILQYRMQNNLLTYFSSNLDFDGLTDHFALANDGKESGFKANRLMERVRYLSSQLIFDGENLREK